MKSNISFIFILCIFLNFSCNNSNQSKQNSKQETRQKIKQAPKQETEIDLKQASKKDSLNSSKSAVDSFFLKIKGQKSLIIAGKSIGNIKVNERPRNLHLRAPDNGDAGMCKSLNRWTYGKNNHKILDIFSECVGSDSMRLHIKWIRTNDAAFKTPKDIQVGSTLKNIKSIYAPLHKVATYLAKDSIKMVILTSTKQGISFEMTTQQGKAEDSDTCRAILVHSPNRSSPGFYFSFYNHLTLL